jgi:hypothetical protein
MMTIYKVHRSIGFIAVTLAMAVAGCGGGPESIQTLERENNFKEGTKATPPTPKMDSDVLEACNQVDQESALVPGQVVDWNELELSTCYQLWMNLLQDRRGYEGKADITYTNESGDTQDDLVFRLYPNAEKVYSGELEVTSTWVDGTQILPDVFLPDQTGLRLPLIDPVKPGDTVVIEMEFQGRLNDGLESSPDAYGIFNYSQDEDVATYANWYPILAEWENGDWKAQPVSGVGDAVVSEVGLYLVEITTPQEIQVITSGMQINHSSTADSELYSFASGPVREFFVVSGTNFTSTQSETGGNLIKHWGLPGGEGRSGEALQATVDSLVVFGERFGPYPYRELEVVSAPMQLASGVEYPGLFLMRDDLYYPNSEQPYLLSLIIAHETAHQWWYGLVGSDVLTHPWQDEALTTFSSLLYLEQFQPQVYSGTVAYFTKLSNDLNQKLDIGRPVSSFINSPEIYSPIVYSQGSLFFVELRDKIGDKDFFEALRSYFTNNIYHIAAPQDLLVEFSNACQCDLDEFFNQWGVK